MKYQNKAILGGFVGNVVEAYDMSICYFLATEMSRYLMGSHSGNLSIVFTLMFIAYLAKPIGAFLLGLYSDLYGRKNVLMVSILIMGLCTASIGLIPNYQHIGLWAAALLLVLRILQSLALGSEFLNSASLLVESGNDSQKGFRGCWSSAGVKSGYLLACLVVEGYHYLVHQHPNLESWWRFPFLIALLTTLVGFAIRARMPESLAYIVYYANRKKPSTKDLYKQGLNYIKKYPFMFYYAFFSAFLSVTTGFFFYLYIPLHAIHYANHSQKLIMTSNIIALALVSILIPCCGWLSDRVDRLKMLFIANLILLLLAYPFMQIVNYGNGISYIVMQLLISIPCACYYSVSTVILTELFPLSIRCTSLSIVFSIAASLATGIPPLLSDYLVHATHLPSAPCVIIIVLSGIVLVNIKILANRYRTAKNLYLSSNFEKENQIFTLQYNKIRI